MTAQLGVAAVEQRIVQVRVQDPAFEIVEVLCPTGLCGRADGGWPSQTWKPLSGAETGHITPAG
jgi:hypothetical protein